MVTLAPLCCRLFLLHVGLGMIIAQALVQSSPLDPVVPDGNESSLKEETETTTSEVVSHNQMSQERISGDWTYLISYAFLPI